MTDGKGYPIPSARRRVVRWVNKTPHLSNSGAAIHQKILNVSRGRSYAWYAQQMAAFLEPLLTEERSIGLLRTVSSLAVKGPGKVLAV